MIADRPAADVPAADIPAYLDFLPRPLLGRLASDADEVAAVPGLRVARGLREQFPHIETDEALALVVEVYHSMRGRLARVLEQRKVDRAFLDEQPRATSRAMRRAVTKTRSTPPPSAIATPWVAS